MKRNHEKNILVRSLALLLLALPALSFAAVNSAPIETSMRINVSDLDLSQDEGIETLYARLKTNVEKICGAKRTQVTGSRITASKIERHHRKCSRESLDRAVQGINLEKLTDLHREASS